MQYFFFLALGVDGQELIFVNVCIKSLFKNSVYTIKCLLYIGLGDKNSKDRVVGKVDKIICYLQTGKPKLLHAQGLVFRLRFDLSLL